MCIINEINFGPHPSEIFKKYIKALAQNQRLNIWYWKTKLKHTFSFHINEILKRYIVASQPASKLNNGAANM